MSVLRSPALMLATAFLWQLPTASFAYGGGEGDDGGAAVGLKNSTTRSVVKTLTRGASRCGELPRVYRFDCYRWVYKRAADQLSGNPAYALAFNALAQVESKLDYTVKQNRDPSQPIRRRALETYKPIKPAAIPRVTRQTEKAMAKAETILLRSPATQREHYARIAQAVNSNKILLRSALLPSGLIRIANHLMKSIFRRI